MRTALAGRLWPLIRHGTARFRWPLVGLGAVVVVLACVLVIPQWLVRWEPGAQADMLTAADRAKAINDVRTILLQAIGGAVLLLGAYFTWTVTLPVMLGIPSPWTQAMIVSLGGPPDTIAVLPDGRSAGQGPGDPGILACGVVTAPAGVRGCRPGW
jgi:hypothetical protein